MTLLAVLVGVALTLWVVTVAVTAFVIWTYVYKPWKTMRTDMQALARQVTEALSLLNRERVMSLSDEEIAAREKLLQAKRSVRERVHG